MSPFFTDSPAPSPPPAPAPARGDHQELQETRHQKTGPEISNPPISPRAPELQAHPPRPSSQGAATYTLLFGAKGMGKTTYARAVWWARRRAGGSGVLFDPKAENGDMGQVVRTPGELSRLIGDALQEGRQFSAVVQLGWGESAEAFWPIVFAAGNLLLVLDEAQDYAGLETSSRSGVIQIVGKGRSRGIDILSTVRTPPEVHKQLRGNQDVVVTFRQSERDYAEGLASRYFPGPGMADRILALPRFHYLRSHHGNVTRGRVQI